MYNKNIILEVLLMPRYKLSPEERAAEKERKDNLRNIMKGLDVKNFDDLKDVFKMMVGEMLENGLDGELDDELGYTKYDYRNKEGENSRNGYSKKTLKTSFGETEIKVPRDRDGEFEPQLVKKNQTTLTGDIEEKIISMYAKGMTTSDIEAHIRDIYGLECSDTTISRITDKILPVVREWQSRPLEEIYAVVFMDAIHFHVRSEGQIIKKAVYIAIGINEGFNRQLRKVTKSKSVFPTDDSLLKMLYLAMIDITKKWTGKRKDWGQIHSQLEIFFADRLPQ